MTSTKGQALLQKLKFHIISLFKDRSSNDEIEAEEAEVINETTETTKTPVKENWNDILYLSGNKVKVGFADGGDDVITRIDWIDNNTKINNLGPPMVLVSGHTNKKYRRKIALVKTTEPYSVESLPDVPETIYRPGVIRTQTHIYILGGYRYSRFNYRPSRKVYRLCLQTNQWETCPSMPSAVVNQISFEYKNQLYIIGSQLESLIGPDVSKKAYRYNIETSKWSPLKDLPYGVNKSTGSVTFYFGMIIVVTRKQAMQYDSANDEWEVRTFKDLKKRPTAMTIDGKLCAFVGSAGVYAPMVYDQEKNVWLQWEPTSD